MESDRMAHQRRAIEQVACIGGFQVPREGINCGSCSMFCGEF